MRGKSRLLKRTIRLTSGSSHKWSDFEMLYRIEVGCPVSNRGFFTPCHELPQRGRRACRNSMHLATHPVACGRHLIGLPCMGYFREAHQWASSCRVSAFPTFQLVQTLEKRSLDIAGGRLCTGGCGRVVVESQLLDKQKDPHEAGLKILAPRVGLEPTTTRLTAAGSTIELSRNCQAAHVLCS